MKIEKGKLYYDTLKQEVFKCSVSQDEYAPATDKIAVHCKNIDDWAYVKSKGYSLTTMYYGDSKYGLYSGTYGCNYNGDDFHVILIEQFKEFYPEKIINHFIGGLNGDEERPEHYAKGIDTFQRMEANCSKEDKINPQPHYDNSRGSLYQIAEQRGWNSYQFDIVKRIDRSLKKGQFKEDLKKTKDLIDLWLREYGR